MKRLFLRILAISLLAIVVTCAFAIFIQPLWSAVVAERSKLEQNLSRIARQSIIEGRAAEYAALLEQFPQSRIDDHIYRASSAAAAEALFQKDIAAAAERSGVAMNAINGLVARQTSGFTQIAVRIDATASAEQVAELLRTLKEASKVMHVGKAAVRVRRQEDEAGPAELGLNAEIFAYARI